MKRHLVRAAGLTAATLAGVTGCQNKPQNTAQSSAAANQQPLVDAHPTTAPTVVAPGATIEPPATSQQALAIKMQSYAHDMEQMLSGSKRVRKTDPSDVDFLDPADFRLGPTPIEAPKRIESPVQVVPIAQPVIDSTQSFPNQRATIASATPPPDKAAGGVGANRPVNYATVQPDTTGPVTSQRPAARDTSVNAGDLELSLARNLRESPKDLWAHLDFQILQFLKDKPTPQLDALAPLGNEDRELITAVMDALSNFRNAVRSDNNMLMSRKVRPLLDLADRVRAQADLIIPTLALCTKVDASGVYEPIEPARFTALKEHKIIIYCEVENFASHLTEKKLWETKLSQEVVLYTETGLPVWQDKTENIPDFSRNRRHDFFVVKPTKFPANITIGRYLLKVTIVDQQASRVAEATIPVTFVAQ